MPAAFISTASEISRRLYCGYYQSRCGGVTGSQQYTAAYDWRSTTAKRWVCREDEGREGTGTSC
jgi:hypothetical protein